MNLLEVLNNPSMEKVIQRNYYKYKNFDILENRNLINELKDEIIKECGKEKFDFLNKMVYDYYQYRLDYKKIKVLQNYSLVKSLPRFSKEDEIVYNEFCKDIQPRIRNSAINKQDINIQKILVKLYIDKYYYRDSNQKYDLSDVINECLIELDNIIKNDNYSRQNYEIKVFQRFSKVINKMYPRKVEVPKSLTEDELQTSLEDKSFENNILHKENKELINNILSKIDPRHSQIIKDYYGIDTDKLSTSDIEKKYNITRTRLHQILRYVMQRTSILKEVVEYKKEKPRITKKTAELETKTKNNRYEVDYDKLLANRKLLNFMKYTKDVLRKELVPNNYIHPIDINKYINYLNIDESDLEKLNSINYIEDGVLNVDKYTIYYNYFKSMLLKYIDSVFSIDLFNQIINDFGPLDFEELNNFKDCIDVVPTVETKTTNNSRHLFASSVLDEVLIQIDQIIDYINPDETKFLYLYDFDFEKYMKYFRDKALTIDNKLIDTTDFNKMQLHKLNLLKNFILAAGEYTYSGIINELHEDLNVYAINKSKHIQ